MMGGLYHKALKNKTNLFNSILRERIQEYPNLGYANLGYKLLYMSEIYSSRYRIFTNQLIKAREKVGLTQVEVAQKLQKPQSYISKIELGERKIDFIELEDLCAIYKVSISYFQTVGRKEENNS